MTIISEEVAHFRLVTGEDILAQVILEEDDEVTLLFPMKIIFIPADSGSFRISLMEWIFTRISPSQTFVLKERDIITSSEPSDVLVQYYWEALNVLMKKRELTDSLSKKKTVDKTKEIENFLDDLESEIQEEGGNADFIRNLLEAITSNNRGTLH